MTIAGKPAKASAPRLPNHRPDGRAGASFKPKHLDAILADTDPVGFLEVHAENYMGAGGLPHANFERIRRDFAVSLHGVCMSIGAPAGIDPSHLSRFAALVARYEPALVSEHLAWSTHNDVYYNDLLPLPYTEATLATVCEHIDRVQEAIGRPILMENPSTYVASAESTYAETDFIRTMSDRTGCGLLLDVNNVFVSATNHQYSAQQYLANFPLERVGEIHLAGHDTQADDKGLPLLIDSHDRAVADPVWELYETVIARRGPVATLIEWDSEIPDWPVLKREAQAAQRILDGQAPAAKPAKRHVAHA